MALAINIADGCGLNNGMQWSDTIFKKNYVKPFICNAMCSLVMGLCPCNTMSLQCIEWQ